MLLFVCSSVNVLFSWREWNCVTDLFHGQVDDLYNVCVSEFLATTVWTWSWAAHWVWTWTHVLLSTTPLSCSDSPRFFSFSNVYLQFSLPLGLPATRIQNRCFFFFFFCLTPHLLPSSTFSALFPMFLPVLEMLGFSLFARDSTAFLGRVVEKIKAERIKTSDQVRTKQE